MNDASVLLLRKMLLFYVTSKVVDSCDSLSAATVKPFPCGFQQLFHYAKSLVPNAPHCTSHIDLPCG